MKKKERHIPRLTFREWFLGAVSFLIFLISSQVFTLLMLHPPPPRKKERKKIYKLLLWGYARLIVYSHFNIRTRLINPYGENFEKPAVIIVNHQSILDIPYALMLAYKVLIITNDWAENPWFHFFIGKYFDFFSVSKGIESYLEDFRKWIEKGYSILIFPEGVRWGTGNIQRFHKGAFYLAEKLNLDILPVLLHGTGTINTTRKYYFKSGIFTVKIMQRISPGNSEFGTTYAEKTKNINKMFREEYRKISENSHDIENGCRSDNQPD